MKASRYNFVFPLKGDMYLIYNALSGGFAKIDSDTLDLLTRIRQGERIEADSQISHVVTNLEKGKFIVQDDFDEIAYLKVLMNAKRFQTRSLGITIAPTLACNFACTYCYETHAPVTMNADTVVAVKQFLESEVTHVEGLGITWFGGEPLLALDTIRDISHCILALQKEKEFLFEAGIITNGYLLTRKTAEELKESTVKTAQVTVDGPKDVHDKRRPLKNGKGTFQRILDNLVEISDILDISIRVNVDKSNIDRAPEVLDILKSQGLREKVGIYFAPVLDITTCKDVSVNCFSDETYSQHEITLYEKALKRGFGIRKYPAPLRGLCGAVSLHSILVDPYGNLHKCWNTVGVEHEKVGKIGAPMQMDPILVSWLSWDPLEKKTCKTCRVFPICMGGCPYFWRTREMNCSSWKYNLEEMLRLYYSSKVASTHSHESGNR